MHNIKINIVSFSAFDPGLLKIIAGFTGAEFRTEVYFTEGHIDLSEYLEPSRGQYKGNDLIKVGGAIVYSTFMVGSEQYGSPKNPN